MPTQIEVMLLFGILINPNKIGPLMKTNLTNRKKHIFSHVIIIINDIKREGRGVG